MYKYENGIFIRRVPLLRTFIFEMRSVPGLGL